MQKKKYIFGMKIIEFSAWVSPLQIHVVTFIILSKFSPSKFFFQGFDASSYFLTKNTLRILIL